MELISDLKKLGELDQLRHAREAMHAVYPLSEGNFSLPILIINLFPWNFQWNIIDSKILQNSFVYCDMWISQDIKPKS